MPLNLHATRLHRPWAMWLAVLIALFGALAPTVSHALVWSHGAPSAWNEICTSTSVAAPVATAHSENSPDGQESTLSLAHCPFCLLFTDRGAPAPHALVHLFAVSGDIKVPTVRQAFFFRTPFALAPPPRGPPTFVL